MNRPPLHPARFGSPKHLLLTGVFCLVALGAVVAIQAVRAEGRIVPNVRVGGVEIGGLTPEDARAKLRGALERINTTGLVFRHEERTMTVRANERSAAPPSQSPVTYDIDAMVERAFGFGHNQGLAGVLKANLQTLFTAVDQPAEAIVDRQALRDLLTLRFGELETLSRDAGYAFTRGAAGSASTTPAAGLRIDVTPASTGRTFDYEAAIEAAAANLARWQAGNIELAAALTPPTVTAEMAEAAKERVRTIIGRGDASLAYDDFRWTLSATDIPETIILRPMTDGGARVTLKHEAIDPLLRRAASEIESDPKPTRMKIENERAVEFEGGSIGRRINRDASLARFDELFETSENGVIPLVVDTVPAQESDPAAEELGIRELLGYGTSNFAGSPKNRRINIANGAKRLNGIIIKPGEEIGLLDYLRPFDASGGYVPELVIKNNRTVPEFGGGLCQIGTTTFRAVMGAGLPITQRQNHSYRVRYYEPAGTDATLYDPAPDFKFVNDTSSHAVLVTHIIGDTLRFELWGTRDGRVQEQSKIRTWNVTPPPPAKLIETSALAEGVQKCFESPHAGATTSFTYSITYPNGEVKDQEFRSVYKPWQQQCLVGKAGAPNIILQSDGALKEIPSASPVTDPASSTPQIPA